MNPSRRKFIKTTALSSAGVGLSTLLPGSMSAACSRDSANDKLVVGLIGCNNMGNVDLGAFLRQPNVECAAMCDVDRIILELRAGQIEKDFGQKPDLYGDFREVIDRKDIDAVIIGTPDHWHCLPMIYACEAGKDVYVEKPMGNTIEECNLMVKAARRYKSVVQVGQWQRSDPHWQDAVDFVHSGKLGRIRTVKAWAYIGYRGELPVLPDEPVPEGVDYDMWLGPAPKRPFNRRRFHGNFRWYWDYAGGLMTDWGVHMLDYALYGMNEYKPNSVMSSGAKYAFPDDARQTPDTSQSIYEFDDFGLVWEHTIGIYNGPYGNRPHGVAFIGEYGNLIVDRSGWEVIPDFEDDKPKMEAVPLIKGTGGGLDLHVANFIDCIKTRKKPNCDVEIGAHIARIAHLGNIAYKTGRKVSWDSENNVFINDDEANQYIKANYRSPWKLPVV